MRVLLAALLVIFVPWWGGPFLCGLLVVARAVWGGPFLCGALVVVPRCVVHAVCVASRNVGSRDVRQLGLLILGICIYCSMFYAEI